MIFWFDKENPAYLQAVYNLETAKADLLKMKMELAHIVERRQQAISTIELLETNLEYLKKFAKIINIREYTRLTHMLSAEYQVLRYEGNSTHTIEKQIRRVAAEIANMEVNLPSLQSKVLEFKRND
jgi:predicted RNase H-like nuclease (RuvC/YqgF family)